ncbi:MAG TPA: hypothetical protein VIG47_10865, partial [Gemmatimonadaceae bacterium]
MTAVVPDIIGLAALAELVYHGGDPGPVRRDLAAKIDTDPRDAAAWLDLSMLAQLGGERERGLELQANALALTRVFRRVH